MPASVEELEGQITELKARVEAAHFAISSLAVAICAIHPPAKDVLVANLDAAEDKFVAKKMHPGFLRELERLRDTIRR